METPWTIFVSLGHFSRPLHDETAGPGAGPEEKSPQFQPVISPMLDIGDLCRILSPQCQPPGGAARRPPPSPGVDRGTLAWLRSLSGAVRRTAVTRGEETGP
jgi:hypothetical protein